MSSLCTIYVAFCFPVMLASIVSPAKTIRIGTSLYLFWPRFAFDFAYYIGHKANPMHMKYFGGKK